MFKLHSVLCAAWMGIRPSRVSLLATLLVSATLGFGQTSLATITGTLTDPTGAVLADVPVSLKNLDNGSIFTAGSSSTGNYTVSQLPIGLYDLTVTAAGFKTYTRPGFRLVAGQTLREDIKLEIGQTSESVTVTSEVSMLKTESTEISHNVTLSQLANLPILQLGVSNQGFRDPLNAVRLVPGVIYVPGGLANSMVVNGTPANSVQTRLDGQTVNPTSARLLGYTGQTQPSVDAIEEVAIQTSNFSAEFGTSGGAVVNMVAKSGSNQYHGSVYDYMINEALNARQPYTGLRNVQRQHDWGFTFGGPVRIPKLYNGKSKTFFFWSFEQYSEKRTINTIQATVPTPEYRAGNFASLITQENRLIRTAAGNYVDSLGRTIASGTIFDPATQRAVGSRQVRDPFPNNAIPVTRFDPIAVKILALVPQPLGPNATRGQLGNNYQAPVAQDRISRIPSIKFDQNIGSKHRFSFYYHVTSTDSPRTATGLENLPDLITASISSYNHSPTYRINHDWTVTPRLLLHFGVGWTAQDLTLGSPTTTYDPLKELGLNGHTYASRFPRIEMGFPAAALGGMNSLGPGTFNEKYFERRPSGNVSSSYVTGSHTFKLGAEYRLEKYPSYPLGGTAGVYTFGADWTRQTDLQGVSTTQGFDGFALSSFLLGGMSAFSQNALIAAAAQKSQTALYLQDTWKVTRKLTMDYGLRWDYGTYAREQYGRYSSFGTKIPNPSAEGRLGGLQYEAACKCNFAANYPYALGPRLGIAYQYNPKTVIRAGVGVVYNPTTTVSGAAAGSAAAGSPGFGLIVGELKNGKPAGVNAVWPSYLPNLGQPVGSVAAASPTYLDPNAGRPARLLQFNVTVQREITRDMTVEVAYVANRGVWWADGSNLEALNALRPEYLTSRGFNDFTSAAEAQLLTSNLANLSAAQRSTLAARGIVTPYSSFPTSQTVRQSLLPFPHYGGLINPASAPLGKSWYDSMQITVNKRFSHGVTFNANYNWSKNLTQYSALDIFNRPNGKNLSSTDLPNQLRITVQYEVPQLRNSGLPVLSNGVVSHILSGWGTGVYMNYQSAPILARPSSNGTVPISQFLGRGPGLAQLKTDPATGKQMNPWSVDWVDYDGTRHTDPLDINCHCFDATKTVMFNPNAWENIPNGFWAADQSNIRSYRGIRIPQENANFSRNFRIKEGINLNVRVEFTNIFNRMQLPQPTTAGNFAAAPTKFTAGATNGLYSGGFGTIVPVNGTQGMRSGTFVGRLTF
ncbi:MAG: TonB-dependent receptor [Bryobacteraceae bacterium]